MQRSIPLKGISALAVCTAVLLWIPHLLRPSDPHHVSALLILGSGLQSAVAFRALLWALTKSNMVFFSIFVGDALLRLAVLGAAVCWLTLTHQPYTMPLLCLAGSYLVLSLVQIVFFTQVR